MFLNKHFLYVINKKIKINSNTMKSKTIVREN